MAQLSAGFGYAGVACAQKIHVLCDLDNFDFHDNRDNGQAVVHKTAPDTITTWLTSAFSVHPVYGLSVIQKPAELTTFKSLFVSLDLPYSAIRGEDLCMKVLAFNYHEKMLYVSLVMGRSEGISNIRLIRTSRKSKNRVEYRAPMRVSHRIGKVKSNEVGETSFCFTPNSLGHMPIRVNLTTTSRLGDGVVRMLLVEPEGVPRTQNLPLVLDIDGGSNFEEVVPVMFPGDAVSGSQRIRVSLAGDLLGSVFDNIDDLLQMPYGCGEQNMLYFAPNVFLIDYLQKTSTYTEELAKTAENYMLVGYQKEITYQHQDGSYSAFGEERTNGSGSMWLTAFVTKCFAQSMALEGDVIAITPMLVTKSLTWMVSKQLKNGSFPEPGKVFNKNMQGGSAKGEALTAYVVIALAEAEANFEDIDMYNLKTRERE
ncbi:CD109 antigen-like [Littorina saxatilis]|uniref:CD109 antigen-like n=1 Tax=Littorina saxatilis TaxID=31220 RepID=UPI0038B49E6D